MAQRRRQAWGNNDPRLDELLKRTVSGIGETAAVQVDRLRERVGVAEVSELIREAAGRGDLESAKAMSSELRAVTSESILAFGRMGYEVKGVGGAYERALGGGDFSGAEAVSPDAAPRDVADAVVKSTENAWGGLRALVGSQAEAKAGKRLTGSQGMQEPDARVMSEMRKVWDETSKENVRLGGRVEDLRSGIGLRTLSALVARYYKSDSDGLEDAMPKAYVWAERAYWMTKHTVQGLFQRPEYAGRAADLREIGESYEERLGGPYLAAPGASEFTSGEAGWDVVKAALWVTSDAWRRLKQAVG
jgi:hypothetical protein